MCNWLNSAWFSDSHINKFTDFCCVLLSEWGVAVEVLPSINFGKERLTMWCSINQIWVEQVAATQVTPQFERCTFCVKVFPPLGSSDFETNVSTQKNNPWRKRQTKKTSGSNPITDVDMHNTQKDKCNKSNAEQLNLKCEHSFFCFFSVSSQGLDAGRRRLLSLSTLPELRDDMTEEERTIYMTSLIPMDNINMVRISTNLWQLYPACPSLLVAILMLLRTLKFFRTLDLCQGRCDSHTNFPIQLWPIWRDISHSQQSQTILFC